MLIGTAILAGAAVLFLAVKLMRLDGKLSLQSPGYKSGYGIVSLETAFSPDKADEIIKTWKDLKRIPFALESIFLDWFFIPAYFLLCTALYLLITKEFKSAYKRLWILFLLFPLLASVFDVSENLGMLSLLNGSGGGVTVFITGVFAALKFSLLAALSIPMLISFRMSRRNNKIQRP